MNIGSSEVTLCCLMWVCGPSKQDLLVWSLGVSIDPLGRFFMSSGNILFVWVHKYEFWAPWCGYSCCWEYMSFVLQVLFWGLPSWV